MTSDEFSTAYARIQHITGSQTQTELAQFLGISQGSVSVAMRRGHIPDKWLLVILRRTGINPDWVLTGEGEQNLSAVIRATRVEKEADWLADQMATRCQYNMEGTCKYAECPMGSTVTCECVIMPDWRDAARKAVEEK